MNLNGQIFKNEEVNLSPQNRGFKYGDAIFETVKVLNNKVVFWEDHYFRLMASMRMLRMEIPMTFTLEFLEEEILKTTKEIDGDNFRVRLSVYRKDGGLYTPKTNEVDFLIEANQLNYQQKEKYTIDLYKDFYNFSGLLSTVKTTNRMLNTIASIYASENDFDNCILLNERRGVVEVTNGNVFIIKGNTVKTPALAEGCIKGIIRNKVIEILQKNKDFVLEETSISPFEIQKADEVFITNAIIGIQPVTNYRKKTFTTEIGKKIASSLKILEVTAK